MRIGEKYGEKNETKNWILNNFPEKFHNFLYFYDPLVAMERKRKKRKRKKSKFGSQKDTYISQNNIPNEDLTIINFLGKLTLLLIIQFLVNSWKRTYK